MDGTDRTIQAYSEDGNTVQCMRCMKKLATAEIAMFIRTKPADAFNAWCPACTRWILAMAAAQCDLDIAEGIAILF